MIKKFFVAIFILAVFSWFGLASVALAGVEHNISGYAWSENIGWISLNSLSDGSPINYGVNIDPATGNFSGHAWSENVGWISFNRSDTGDPPANPFKNSGPIAWYNKNTKEVTGWMKVLSAAGGWDGWIKFYNVTLDTNGDFHGWAWSDVVAGWVSFNSVEGGGSSYKVTSTGVANQPPTATGFNVSAGGSSSYCGATGAHSFTWIYSDPDGNTESQFKLQVSDKSNFSSPQIDRTVTGLSNPSPTTNSQLATVVNSPVADQLGYNTTYYWRVAVWDSQGADSGWVVGPSFATQLHRYPTIDFSWSPQIPHVDEDTTFTDQSTVYGGSSKTGWSWTFSNANPLSSVLQNPITKFLASGSKTATLQVTDSNSYSCSLSKNLNIKITLPGWKEILPR